MRRIFVLCLVSVFFVLAFVGCADVKYNDKNITNRIENSSIQNLESNEAIIPKNKIDMLDPSVLECLSRYEIPEASFWRDNKGEYYIYIKEWQTYRKLSGLTEYPELHIRIDQTSIVIDDNTSAFAIYIQSGKSDTEIVTYHFNKDNDEVESYSVLLETREHDESNHFMINLHSTNKGEFFFIPQLLNLNNDSNSYWPIVRYETSDGGKTWEIAEILDLASSWREFPTVVKFVTKEVGIVSYRYVGSEDLRGRTYLTTDGGLTWNRISNLTYPFDDIYSIGYTEVYDLEQRNEEYLLTVEIHFASQSTGNEQINFCSYIYFKSDNFDGWAICEP